MVKDHVVPAAGVLLIAALSVQLVRAKSSHQALEREFTSSVRTLVSDIALPTLPVQLEAEATTIGALCNREAPVLLFFSLRTCPACAKVEKPWSAVAARSSGVHMIRIHLDGLPAASDGAEGVRHVTASPSAVIERFRTARVPAVVATDSLCRVTAAGTGVTASRAVLQSVAADQ